MQKKLHSIKEALIEFERLNTIILSESNEVLIQAAMEKRSLVEDLIRTLNKELFHEKDLPVYSVNLGPRNHRFLAGFDDGDRQHHLRTGHHLSDGQEDSGKWRGSPGNLCDRSSCSESSVGTAQIETPVQMAQS